MKYRWFSDDHRDIRDFQECFEAEGTFKSEQHLQWQYIKSARGYPPLAALGVVDDGEREPEITAIYAVFLVRFLVNGEKVLGAQSLDTLTVAKFRGQGLFNKLAKIVYSRAEEVGVQLIYGFPNKNSAPGFFGKLGWTRFGEVPFLIKPLRLSYFLERLPVVGRGLSKVLRYNIHRAVPRRTNLRILWDVPYAEQYDRLWQMFSQNVGVAVDRDAQYMRWRLTDNPTHSYRNVAAFDESDEMVAICIYSIQKKHGGVIAYLMDLIYLPGHSNAAEDVLGLVGDCVTEAGCDAVLCWCLPHSNNYALFLGNGFRAFPPRLRPIELNFGARALSDRYSGTVSSADAWYMSYLDSDTV